MQFNGYYRHNNVYVYSGVTYTSTDVAMVAIDLDAGKLWFGKNGTWNGSGNPATGDNPAYTGVSGTLFPMAYLVDNCSLTANFGASAFSHSVPSGFNSGWYVAPIEVTVDPLQTVTALSGTPEVQLAYPPLNITADMSVLDVFRGYILPPVELSAQSVLSGKLNVSLLVLPLTTESILSAGVCQAIPSQTLSVSSGMSLSDIFRGWFLEPGSLAVTPGLSAGPQVSFVVPGLSVLPALGANLLVAVPAEFAVLLAMSVADVVSFGSSDFVVTYICKLTPQPGSSYSEITLPMSSFQGRFKSGDPSYLSVVIPGDDYTQAISNRNDPDNPPELSVYMAKTCIGGHIISEQLMAVDLEDVNIYQGGTNISITLEGHRTNTYSAKAVSLTGASYKNLTGGKLRYRCEPDLFLRPGNTVTVNGDTFTADSISISMSVDSQTMEVAEA